jgi:SAM-dependent methyltransferase
VTSLAQRKDAATAYDDLAPHYDEFTAAYAHDAWVHAIERRATELGLTGRRALDLACGTGKSTLPLLALGYSALGCDISEGMVREARRKLPEDPDAFLVADMRDLPRIGEFDLVLCLDDAVNYLVSDEELEATFAGVAGVLAADGVFAFDVNSLSTYRQSFARSIVRERDGLFYAWKGEGTTSLGPGDLASATLEIFIERDDGLWERRSSRHVQRHHRPRTVREALARSGLECRLIAGQLPGARLEQTFDERRHIKLVYFAGHAGAGHDRGTVAASPGRTRQRVNTLSRWRCAVTD